MSSVVSTLKKVLLPVPNMSAKEYVRCSLRDLTDRVMLRNGLIPPTRWMFDGPQDRATFVDNGNEFFEYFVGLGGLQPNERVLDVGCGIGRKAIPLTRYLTAGGAYEGFDIVKLGIEWCRRHITVPYSNFHFQLADIYNKYYNPNGSIRPIEYTFPFPSDSFDFVIVTSVFTHMLPADIRHYHSEVARVLKPGGRCLFSYLLLNEEALQLIAERPRDLSARHDMGMYCVESLTSPESAVFYREAYVRDLLTQYGLDIKGPVHYGAWCGRTTFLSYQDLIVAIKEVRS
jgi:SAM-dependent methyltransferase